MTQRVCVDRLFIHADEVVSLTDGPAQGARRGADMARLGVVADGAIAVHEGRIVAVGPTDDIGRRYTADEEIDLSGFVVLPGFVDCHTHPVFASTRHDEFHLRCAGADYMAIAAAGGGILSSMRAVRAASEVTLLAKVREHFDGFLRHGTTTIEAKSGYGLSTAAELASLRALTELRLVHPLTVSRTFLGAHEFPPEFRADREGYLRLLIDEMLPAVVAEGLAESADVFAEPGVFDREQSARVLRAARDLGLRLRVHADELQPMGGAELAVELGADSADHLGRISLEGQDRIAASTTTAVLLPGTTFFLSKPFAAPGRSLLDKGAAVALATDFNPGSCYTQSMPLIISLGCIALRMTPEECVVATTLNPAASLHLDAEVGSLHPGKRADFAVLALPTYRALGYTLGGNPVAMTVKDGVPVVVQQEEWRDV